VIIPTVVTGADGTLKIEQTEEFVDSKATIEQIKAFAAKKESRTLCT